MTEDQMFPLTTNLHISVYHLWLSGPCTPEPLCAYWKSLPVHSLRRRLRMQPVERELKSLLTLMKIFSKRVLHFHKFSN